MNLDGDLREVISLTKSKNDWRVFIKDLRDMVSMAQDGLPLDEISQEEDVFNVIGDVLSKFDFASWLMFDTVENRDATMDILRYLWKKTGKSKYLEEGYIQSVFNSYFCIYRVNFVKNDQYLVQNLAKKGPGFFIEKSKTYSFEEGDVFLARILKSDQGNFIFQVADKVSGTDGEELVAQFDDLQGHNFFSSQNTEDLEKSLANGSPDVVFVYSLARKMVFEGGLQDLFTESLDDSWMNFTLDVDDLDTFMQFVQMSVEEEESGRILGQLSLIKERYLDFEGQPINWAEGDKVLTFASREGLIGSDYDLSVLVSLLDQWGKKMADFKKEPIDLDIKDKIMSYKSALASSYKGFYSDPFIREKIIDGQDVEGLFPHFFQGFERFVDYIIGQVVILSPTGRFRSYDLDEIVDFCKLEPIRSVSRTDERHFPFLQIWRGFGLIKGILEMEGEFLTVSDSYDYYQGLDMDEKYAIWFSSLTNPGFLEECFKMSHFLVAKEGQEFMEEFKAFLIKVRDEGLDLGLIKGLKNNFFLQLFLYLNLIQPKEEWGMFDLSHLGQGLGEYLNIGGQGKDKAVIAFPKK